MFLPGEHALDVNIIVTNTTGLTMLGKLFSGYVATVVRKGRVGFNFTNMMYRRTGNFHAKNNSREKFSC